MPPKKGEKFETDGITQDMVDKVKLTMTPDAIPDVDRILEIIEDMLNFIETPVMEELEKTDKEEFERLVYGKYNGIEELPFRIISLVVDENRYENIEQLLDMFEILKEVKAGKKNIFEEAEKFGEAQNEKFVYKNFGGKENFIKMMEESKKNTKKKKSNKN